ncbi:MAG: DUF3604 domain-containing protein, partial [Chitinivibrionia bacterium]|nr:DUF3604 domain-containing protein [Chitinivibrionia bacterium]
VYFQDALNQGYHFGVTADGDDHMGQPGGHISPGINVGEASGDTSDFHYSRLGITAVYADTLTRGGIWEALRSRRTYGTTGVRIILAFSVNDAVMGEEIRATSPPRIRASVVGTDSIRSISIIRNGYETVFEVNPGSSETAIDFTDANVNSGETYSYYVRVAQNDDHLAWSSPIWVTIDQKQDSTPPLPFDIVSVIPNPYNTSAKITFSQPQQMPVTAAIFSVDGKLIRTLVSNTMFPQGPSDLVWSGQNIHGERAASGIYFIRIWNKLGYRTAKIALLR